jgi:hypothetical protein
MTTQKFYTKSNPFLCPITIFLENRAVYEIMWKNIVEPDRSRKTIWRMRIGCWITNATNAKSDDVILIAFPLQQWLHGRSSVLRYTHCTLPVLVYETIA